MIVKKLTLASSMLIGFTTLVGIFLASSTISATDSTVDNITLTIPVACTLSSTLDTPHTAITNNGTYTSDIGTTTFTTFCNDSNGYSIYAIGYSGEENTNTKLLATVGGVLTPSSDINTGTATSGNTSAWAMKLSPVSGTYAPTITSDTEGPFSSYHTIPSSYTKVATLTSGTDFTIGSKLQSTYRVYISPTQSTGSYNGKVRYSLVHPNDEPAPFIPHEIECEGGKICYNPNANISDSVGDQTISNTATYISLWASNFQRSGYGFAGWSETFDYSDSTKFYGPNEVLEITKGQYGTKGLSLYAIWIPSAGNLQNWSGCSTMGIGDITALTDQRDNNTYAVAKLADGNCWMIENLRLDDTAAHNSDGTLAQGYHSSFVGLANPEIADFSDSTTSNSLYSTDGSTAFTIVGSNQSYRFPRYNNSNTKYPTANMTSYDSASNIYSLGNYYTWAAAVANTNNNSSGTYDSTSICPSAWHLPTGGYDGEFSSLDVSLGGTGRMDLDSETVQRWLKYPQNYVYSGVFSNNSASSRSREGCYWSSTADSGQSGNNLLIYYQGDFDPGTGEYMAGYKTYGMTVRCVIAP